jgi:beta-lactamase superfamily II metal-dependent hydrolase
MNESNEERGSAGINILWPDTGNSDFQEALEAAEQGDSPNNTSVIIKYSLNGGVTALWMGDLETEFMEDIEGSLEIPSIDILFAPHHGRESGRVPDAWLDQMDPAAIVLGEARSGHLHYYSGWNTITQNRARDITFNCLEGRTDVYVSSDNYEEDFLYNAGVPDDLDNYVGSFDV